MGIKRGKSERRRQQRGAKEKKISSFFRDMCFIDSLCIVTIQRMINTCIVLVVDGTRPAGTLARWVEVKVG